MAGADSGGFCLAFVYIHTRIYIIYGLYKPDIYRCICSNCVAIEVNVGIVLSITRPNINLQSQSQVKATQNSLFPRLANLFVKVVRAFQGTVRIGLLVFKLHTV